MLLSCNYNFLYHRSINFYCQDVQALKVTFVITARSGFPILLKNNVLINLSVFTVYLPPFCSLIEKTPIANNYLMPMRKLLPMGSDTLELVISVSNISKIKTRDLLTLVFQMLLPN